MKKLKPKYIQNKCKDNWEHEWNFTLGTAVKDKWYYIERTCTNCEQQQEIEIKDETVWNWMNEN